MVRALELWNVVDGHNGADRNGKHLERARCPARISVRLERVRRRIDRSEPPPCSRCRCRQSRRTRCRYNPLSSPYRKRRRRLRRRRISGALLPIVSAGRRVGDLNAALLHGHVGSHPWERVRLRRWVNLLSPNRARFGIPTPSNMYRHTCLCDRLLLGFVGSCSGIFPRRSRRISLNCNCRRGSKATS